LVDETVGEADGVYSVDGSDMPKQGEHAVGVARQWCGHVGKVDNCQAGVFAAYASRKGYTLLDRRLYLPEEWFDAPHRERWCKCSIPDATRFKTKQVLALEMVQASVTEGGPRFRWLTCDEAFGRDGAFLEGIAALERWYFAEVPHDTQVWLVPGAPGPQRVDQLAAAVPLDAWQPYLIKEGSPGPLVAEFALQRGVAVRAGLPGPDVWLVWRRGLGENPELKVYLSNAPTHTPVAALVRVAGMRWPIETAFEESVVMRSAKWRRCWPNATTRRLLRCRHRCNRV
jgi:SRSO17 transposase